MSTRPQSFGTRLIGQTENALGAILDRQLAGTGLTAHDWVALTVSVTSGPDLERDTVAARIAGALKCDAARAGEHLDRLADAGLLVQSEPEGSRLRVSPVGSRVFEQVHGEIVRITERLWSDLPAADVDATARVLSTVLERANGELEPRA